MTRETIDWRDGWLCVRHEDTDFTQPFKTTVWWPATKCSESFYVDLIGLETHVDSNGLFGVRSPSESRWIEFYLRNGGRTQPIHTDHSPLPCPKVRKGTPTRYRNGRWEKHLKSAGWVPA